MLLPCHSYNSAKRYYSSITSVGTDVCKLHWSVAYALLTTTWVILVVTFRAGIVMPTVHQDGKMTSGITSGKYHRNSVSGQCVHRLCRKKYKIIFPICSKWQPIASGGPIPRNSWQKPRSGSVCTAPTQCNALEEEKRFKFVPLVWPWICSLVVHCLGDGNGSMEISWETTRRSDVRGGLIIRALFGVRSGS